MKIPDTVIITKLRSVQKLGAYFRVHYPDWKITLVPPGWQQEGDHFIREIAHEGGGHILARAEVNVPQVTFNHFQAELQSLGERSIGDHFLFLKKGVERSPFDIFQAGPHQEWARRSQFLVQGFPLMITEFFTAEGLQCLLA